MVSTGDKVLGSDEVINLVLYDSKVIFTILRNVDGITLGLDVETQLGYLDVPFDGSNNDNLKELFLGDSLEYNGGKFIGSDEVIKVGYTDGKVLGTILGNVDGIIIDFDVGTELEYLDGFFDGSTYGSVEG